MTSHDFEIRAVIKFLTKEHIQTKDIFDRLVAVYGQDRVRHSTVAWWAARFRQGRESLDDDPHPGRPIDAATDAKVAAVEKLVLDDRRLKVVQIAAEVSVSIRTVETILHDRLHLSKVCARWVPRNLSAVDRQRRIECASELLSQYELNEEEFCQQVVTGDETWVHHWDPESKQESMQWKHRDSPPPIKFRTQASAGKIMATVFWDSKGVLLIDYLPHKTTITGEYYAKLMRQLRSEI